MYVPAVFADNERHNVLEDGKHQSVYVNKMFFAAPHV